MSTVANGVRELAVTPAPKAKTSAKMSRCKAAGGATLGQANGRDAQRQAAVILEVLAGARTPTQAAAALNVSVPRYYQMETRALRGLVEACEAKPRGRAPSADKELASLRREQERLQRELTRQQSLVRVTQRHIGLASPASPAKSAAGGPGKKRRRRAVVRALTAAKQLEKRATSDGEDMAASGEAKGSPPGE
jgi:hypothetical protein